MGGLHRGAAGAARDNHSRSSALVPLLFPYKRRRDTTPRHHSRSSCHSQVPLARSLGTRDRSLLWSTPGLLKGSIGADHVGTAAAVAAAFEQPPGSVGVSSSLRGRPKMASVATAEACDANTALLATGELRVLQPIFKVYGQRQAFSGPIVTLKVFEDNVLVRDLLETSGDGQVLVIDGGGSLRCALVGGNLGQLAQNMGWSGIVVNGCIRDVDEINGCDIGVRALASHPQKSNKKGVGERRVPVHIGGTLIRTGEWLYADSDGILISKSELSI